MKTLDEVIEAFETCIVPKNVFCKGCGFEDRCRITEDALHYLKEYKNAGINLEKLRENIEKYAETRVKMEDILADYVALKQWWAEQQVNPPLSWDELKTMEGKPVWVEPSGGDGYWVIPNMFSDSGGSEYFFAEGDQYWKEYMRDADDGYSWQAYRKERE